MCIHCSRRDGSIMRFDILYKQTKSEMTKRLATESIILCVFKFPSKKITVYACVV